MHEPTSDQAKVLSIAYIDLHLATEVLDRLRWKRWFLGLIGPPCAPADELMVAFAYVFLLASSIARQRPNPQPAETMAATAPPLRRRVQEAGIAADDFRAIFPDLLVNTCLAANVFPSTIEGASQSESGQEALLGTKVPRNAALRLATEKANEGFVFGTLFPDLARRMIEQSLPVVASIRLPYVAGASMTTIDDFDCHALEFVDDWASGSNLRRRYGVA